MKKKESKKKILKVPEWLVVNGLKEYIDSCDGDELARLAGEIFGGTCFQDAETESYNFEPNKFYDGEFGMRWKKTIDIKTGKTKKVRIYEGRNF